MDDLYGDLDNFETENVDELRNENKDLKCKLEEYASTLGNLQKDFDKLSSEYKKLELNYSSLLKTARAEIDRKTKMITRLNLEKDQLVINSLQNKGRIPPLQSPQNQNHGNSNARQEKQELAKEIDTEKIQNDISVHISSDKKDCAPHNHERTPQDKITCSIGSRSGFEVKEKEQKPNVPENRDSDKSKIDNREAKDSHLHVVDDVRVRISNNRIKHRRKSMPLLNHADCKFSSDEEQEENPKDHRFRRRSPLRDLPQRKYYTRDHHNRSGPKEPYPRIDEKVTNYRSRDVHKTGSRYGDTDKFRGREGRDKYDTGERGRKRYSPDRSRYNTNREYSMDNVHRSEYVRHRATESSPPKYNPTRRSRDSERHRFQNEEAYAVKHKLYDISEEPACKRMRSKSDNRHSVEDVTLQQDRELGLYTVPISEPEYPYSSLQSPDYANLENSPAVHKIKEIKATANIKLDDPRLTSNKYTVNTKKGKVELKTVAAGNVNIKCINTSTWDIDKNIHKMPTPLKEKPQMSDLLNEIYRAVDQPISNLSLESGEIDSSEDAILFKNDLNSVNKNPINTNIVTSDPRIQSAFNKAQSQDTTFSNKIKDINTQTETNNKREKNCLDFVSDNYTITKADECATNKALKESLINSIEKLGKRDNSNKQYQKKKTDREKRDVDKKDKQRKFDDHNQVKAKYNFRNKSKKGEESQENAKMSARDTVECDLELSDETSDNCELLDHLRCDNETSNQGDQCINNPTMDSRNKNKNINNASDHLSNNGGSMKSDLLCKNNLMSKQQTFSDVQPKNSIDEMHQDPKVKDMKTKLCDLFGDSSSLITPDDLGIAGPSTTKQIIYDYCPLFENTQNALDLDVKDLENVRAQSLKLKPDDAAASDGQNTKSDKKHKTRSNKKDERKKKHKNNIEKVTSDQNTGNAKILTEEPNVVKTVIISTGMQNNCEPPALETGQEGLPTLSVVDNGINNKRDQESSKLKAFATSTPHKTALIEPRSSVPTDICTSANKIKDTSNASSNPDDLSVTYQNTSDVPDVRIIVKRRRKAKVS